MTVLVHKEKCGTGELLYYVGPILLSFYYRKFHFWYTEGIGEDHILVSIELFPYTI